MKPITFPSYHYNGKVFSYVAVLNTASGRSNRYNLLVLTSEDPVTIGREITRTDCKRLIKEFESEHAGLVNFGYRATALKARKRFFS